MKELKQLERTQLLLELLQLAMLTWCLALPLFYVAPAYSDTVQLLWALGTALPVLILHAVCRAAKDWRPRVITAVGLLLLCLLICQTTAIRVFYAVLLGLQALTLFALPWPDGKPVLCVPKLWHLPAPLLLYAFSRIMGSPAMRLAAVPIALLFVLVYVLHLHSVRLVKILCDYNEAAVSDRRIVTLSRRGILTLALLGVALAIAVPILLSARPPQTAKEKPPLPYVAAGEISETAEEPETLPPKDTAFSLPSPAINLQKPVDATVILLALGIAAGVGAGIWGLLSWMWRLRDDKRRHRPPKERDFTVEALPTQHREKPVVAGSGSGWDRRIRRQYARLIRAKTGKTPLQTKTPQELEDIAVLPKGEARTRLHELYEQARYGEQSCSRQDWLAAKSAAQQLRKGTEL